MPDSQSVLHAPVRSSLKVIDMERHGNVIRFISGRRELTDWWGDDWNDIPYEHNAGSVYDEYAHGYREIGFATNVRLSEPCDGHLNSPWSKRHMKDREVPLLSVLRVDDDEWRYSPDFISAHQSTVRIYMGDDWTTLENLPGGVVIRSKG